MDRRLINDKKHKKVNNNIPTTTTAAQVRSSFFLPVVKNKIKGNKREFIIKLKNNEYKVKEIGIFLTELHRDIINAIMISRKKHKETETGYQILYNLNDVYNVLNGRISKVELKNKIQEIRATTFFIEDPEDEFKFYDFNIFSQNRITKIEYSQGRGFFKDKINYYYLAEISKGYLEFEQYDIEIFINNKIIKEIIGIKSGAVKHLIWYCISHKQLNKDFDDILREINIVNENMTKQHIYKIKQDILNNKNTLLSKFHIEIKTIEKTGKLGIFYNQIDNIYFKNNEKAEITYKKIGIESKPNIPIN